MEIKETSFCINLCSLLALCFATIIFTKWLCPKHRSTLPLPPGPTGYPVVGCMPEMMKNKPTFRWIHRLMQERNTEIACIRLGNTYVIPVTSPELAREFLRKQDVVFASRPDCMSGKVTSIGYLTAVLSPMGDQWKKMRRVVASEVLSPAMHRWLYEKRCEEADHLVRYVYKQSQNSVTNGLVNVRTAALHYCGNVMRKLMFSKRFFGTGMEDGGPWIGRERACGWIIHNSKFQYLPLTPEFHMVSEPSFEGENRMTMPEKLQLHGSDHPGMVLTLLRLSCTRNPPEICGRLGTTIRRMQWSAAISTAKGNLFNDTRAGHSKETCFKIHGTPDWYKELQDKRRRDTIPARGFTVDANPMKEVHSETKGELLQELIRLMKTGFHMDSPQGNFAQSDDFAGMNGVFAGYGNNILTSWIVDTGATNHMCASACILTNVSPLPNPTSVHLPDGNTQTRRITNLAVGKQKGNLYFLDTSSFDSAVINSYINNRNNCFTSQVCNRPLWHNRLGHPSSIVLQHIPEIKHLTETQPNDCCICPLAKQHRLSFPSSITRSKHMFELIHTDVWGPYKIASLTNCNYFLTIVDDFTRATWTFLLKHKSQVHHTLATFFTMVNTQFHTSIKVVRSDNGSEFVNAQFSFTKTVLGEAVLTATYLINRLPSSSILDWKSPFEMLYNKPPNIANLRVFGCLCYTTNILPSKTKFDSRASKCIFLGYSQSQKAYKVYSLDSNTLFTSRDVVFHEHTFPFQAVSIDSDPVSIPLPIVDSDVYTPSPDPPIPFSNSLHPFPEPKDYLQASKDSNWVAAMNKELEALKANDTWILTSLPPGKQTIGSRWVFKLKLNPDGSVERYKARLVAKGYQIEGVDYFDSFSPVAKSVTVRIFLALAVSRSWPLLQFDVNNAFLHGSLDEDVYMEPPQGFVGAAPGQVCKLQKSLYGLKQASRQWNLELRPNFWILGSLSPLMHCLFIKSSDSEFTALLVYVDDILLTGNSESALHAVRDYLDDLFTIKDLGQAKYFLGLELARSSHGLQVSQHKYLQDILADTSMLAAKPASTPFPLGLKLVLEDGALLPNPNKYRRLIGRLLYLGFTRPDISFAVQQLSQFLQAPRTSHWDAALHVLRYLKGTPSTGLFFSSSSSSQLTATQMLHGPLVLILDALSQGIAFFWAPPSSLGKLKNRPQFPGLLRRLSIAVWHLPSVSYFGSLIYYAILEFQFRYPFLFSAIISRSTSRESRIPRAHQTPRHRLSWCAISSNLVLLHLPTFQALLNLLISSQNRFLLVTLSVFCPRWACSPTSHLEGFQYLPLTPEFHINLKNSKNNLLLSIEEIKAQITEIMLAAIDNPSNAAEWALAEMINQPNILDKACEELDQVVGRNRLVDESDLHKLNYIKACAKEALRLHPVTPFNVPHLSMEDTVVGGYFIPKGSHVLLSCPGLGRNPRVGKSLSCSSPNATLLVKTPKSCLLIMNCACYHLAPEDEDVRQLCLVLL
ncbi:Retrovirus-related Pol polyprotein from transposon RE2 [Sesamum angolense]|uniref:Retrovirus-related Pol polyprotein from transposon RE2 n=1 Tax=Sesamum angolense TaxID=2727404 RepID=A0AAE1W871_9LAMI|nr:Retrovirus-related Pol polyprotein from transposon RE2 [Sesamum angolense]